MVRPYYRVCYILTLLIQLTARALQQCNFGLSSITTLNLSGKFELLYIYKLIILQQCVCIVSDCFVKYNMGSCVYKGKHCFKLNIN